MRCTLCLPALVLSVLLALAHVTVVVAEERNQSLRGVYDLPPNVVRKEILPGQKVDATLTCILTRNVSWLFNTATFFKCQGNDESQCEDIGWAPEDSGKPVKFNFEADEGTFIRLRIFDVKPSDEGNYKCELWEKKSRKVIGRAYFSFEVREKISSVRFVNTSTVHVLGDELQVTLRTPGSLVCEVLGGYPAPRVEVHRDGSDITNYMRREELPTVDGRILTRLSNDSFSVPDTDWNGQTVKCRAYVGDKNFDGFGESDSKTLLIRHAPHVERCVSMENAVVGRPSILVCTVNANPSLSHVIWELKHLNITLRANQSTSGFRANVKPLTANSPSWIPKKHAYLVELHIENVSMHHEGTFTLTLNNSIGLHTENHHYKPQEAKELPFERQSVVASYSANNSAARQLMSVTFNSLLLILLSATLSLTSASFHRFASST